MFCPLNALIVKNFCSLTTIGSDALLGSIFGNTHLGIATKYFQKLTIGPRRPRTAVRCGDEPRLAITLFVS